MNIKTSGGLILYKEDRVNKEIFVLVAHPGGPFFKNKDAGWWSIPKGEPEPGEDIFVAALREFEEETGEKPQGPYLDLGSIIQKMERKSSPGLSLETGRRGKFLSAMK